MTRDEFDALLGRQRTEVLSALETYRAGSDHLSALVQSVVRHVAIKDLQTAPSLSKWVVCQSWRDEGLYEGHMPLWPYTTSMDAMIPGEHIVMLAKQHRIPGSDINRWCALQDKSKVAYLANDPILACRSAGLHAYLLTNSNVSDTIDLGVIEHDPTEPL